MYYAANSEGAQPAVSPGIRHAPSKKEAIETLFTIHK
jgi:hypothetical protein